MAHEAQKEETEAPRGEVLTPSEVVGQRASGAGSMQGP